MVRKIVAKEKISGNEQYSTTVQLGIVGMIPTNAAESCFASPHCVLRSTVRNVFLLLLLGASSGVGVSNRYHRGSRTLIFTSFLIQEEEKRASMCVTCLIVVVPQTCPRWYNDMEQRIIVQSCLDWEVKNMKSILKGARSL